MLSLGLLSLAGCTSPLIRAQSPEVQDVTAEESGGITLVGDYCGAWGLNDKHIKSIGLVTNLDDTGSDPPPGISRDMLLAEMQSRDVKDPQKILASPKVSLVEVTAILPPAVQKGDAIDVMVMVPKKSTTTSLRGGWLMQCRLKVMENIDGKVHKGHDAGLAEGNVTVDAIFNGETDRTHEVRGRILGGGVSGETRPLGLQIRRDDVSIETTTVIGAAVNQRFHTFNRGSKTGVANPKSDKFVELLVPPRYRHNLQRYIAVVRSVPLRETSYQRAQRLQALEQKLVEPTTSAKASLQLEAIGKEAIPALKRGLRSKDLEIRFNAAEALAYLDEPEAAETLGEAAREQSAFRWSALAALSAMDHVHAYEALSQLLHVSSAETRYGAFRAMRLRNATDPLVRGESMLGQCFLHVIATTGEPLVHISRAERSEIVLFGGEIMLREPQGLFAGKHIVLTAPDAEQIKVSRFTAGQDDRVVYCSRRLDQVIKAIVSVGGTYGDVIQAINEAKKAGSLDVKVAVDAVPRAGRRYFRDDEDESEIHAAELDKLMAGESSAKRSTGDGQAVGSDVADDGSDTYVDPKFTPGTNKGVWSRLTGWFGSNP
jgi:flagellar basal body P-ring protein FlgI